MITDSSLQHDQFKQALNEEQFRAVTAPDGPILVLAAAGTGKTRTLVYRVAHIVQRNISADRILLLTFTNKAAREMLERARDLVGPEVAGIWGGTFHHMANRILRRNARALGYASDYTILDRDDGRKLMSGCVKERGLKSKDFPKTDVLLSLAGSAANTERTLEDVVEQRFANETINTAGVLKVLYDYDARKRQLGVMDFDDLLVNCLRLFRKDKQILERYQDRFEHVLVDEYQDTNTIQAELVDRLADKHKNIMVVGDDFQSIYSWRGADFKNIITFPDRYQNTRIYKLEQNYRSVPEVLDVANVCISKNLEQFQKTLRPTREAYQRPLIARMRDGSAQARFIVDHIHKLQRDGYRLSDIAILYRAHFHALELQLELPRQNIPFVITSGIRFFEQAHIKDVCSLLRLFEYPTDQMAFLRLMELLPGVGEKTSVKIWSQLGNQFNVRDAKQRDALKKTFRPGAAAIWQDLNPLFEQYQHELPLHSGAELIEGFLKVFYRQHLIKTYDNADRRIEDIKELALYLTNFESIEMFLSEVALLTNLDAEDDALGTDDGEAIRLSTVHQAKGLEWPAVIMLWATEGMFPSTRALNESVGGESEERRLFYVAVTRAKDELCFCVPELRRTRDGGVFYCQPSRFIEELPRELTREMRPVFI